MIIALQILILFRESILALLNGWVPPIVTQLVRKLSDNGLVPVKEDIEEQVYADYDDECGVVFFPPVYAQRYAAVCDCLKDKQWFGRLEKVLNIGKHYDINFMRYLTEVAGVSQILGLDVACSVNCTCDILDLSFNNDYERWDKPLQITLLQGNAADPDYRLIGCDAVIAIEMIQKLLPHDLDRLVHNVFGFVKPWVALFTTPNADFNCLLKNLDRNGLRQSDHYFEWTREQLHDWCSNVVSRYPEYMVMSRGVGPGPAGTSHYGCFSQLVLFISKHYIKEMELNVNSLVMVSNLPMPEQVSEIGWITPTTAPSSASMFHRLMEAESSEVHCPQSLSESLSSSSSDCTTVQCVDRSVECNLDVEFGKSFVMFNEDEMYEIKMARKRCFEEVYEIGDVASRLNNTMYDVKHFSKTTEYLMVKNELNSMDMMEEILQLTDKLTCKINHSRGDECHLWNNVNWGENVPYWNQYYKVVGVYNFPYEGRSEDDVLLELLSGEIHKVFGDHVQYDKQGIPVQALMDAVKHITDDVERVIMLMEDSGYELEGESVVYTGGDASEASRNGDFESNFDSESLFNRNSSGHDFKGLINRKLDRKIKMLHLMLPQEVDIKQVLSKAVCRLKKIAISYGQGVKGPARSKWLQAKLLELLTLTEKSILRRKLRNIELDPLKALSYDTRDETASHLSRIKAEDDIALSIVAKYETMLRMAENFDEDIFEEGSYKSFPLNCTGGNSVDVSKSNYDKEFFEVPATETDNLSFSPNDEFRRYTLDEQDIDCTPYWEEKDSSLHQEDTNESKADTCDDTSPILTKPSEELKDKPKDKSTKKSNSSLSKKKSKHSATYIAVKRNIKNNSHKVSERKDANNKNAPEKVLNKLTFDNTLNCIDRIRRKMGPTLVLSVPPKPSTTTCKRDRSKIPGSILELCHPELLLKTTEPFKKTNESWPGAESPVSATEHGQRVEILSQSETVTVALQRMIGTDPDVDAEIYEHELELSDLTSLINETSYFAADMMQTRSAHGLHDLPVELSLTQDSTDLQQAFKNMSCTVKEPVVEIVTHDGRELVALHRTIGTDPEVDTELYEQDLRDSKLTTSLNNMVSLENIPAGVGNVTSEEFFLYDINEPTTSKGIRHVSMEVQCGTETQLSATTSLSPLRMLGPALEFEVSRHDVQALVKNDGVTSTHEILNPFQPKESPWMKSVGIKIKDSNHQINNMWKETETVLDTSAIADNETCINTLLQNSIEIETFHSNQLVVDNLNHTKKKVPYVKTKITKNPILYGGPKSSELRKVEPNRATTRFLHVPKGMRSKLSRGGLHVHSYKDLQVSVDIVYQGEWQRHRRSCNPKKPYQPYTDQLKYFRKPSVPPKPQKEITQKVVAAPIIIRNTKANKMKEAVTKMYLQNKFDLAKREVPKKPVMRQMSKVSSKLTVCYSKPTKQKPDKLKQPPRQTRFAANPTVIKENAIPTTQKKKNYIPPYLKRMSIKQQLPKKSIPAEANLPNLLNINNKGIKSVSVPSQPNIKDLLSALLKVSVEPTNDVKYVVYRNEMETTNCSTAINNTPARPGNHSQDESAYSSQKGTTALNPVIADLNPLRSKRTTTPIKSSIKRKGSDSKMVSTMKKLANLMFFKKSHRNGANVQHLKKNTMSQNSSKNIDQVLDGTANNPAFLERSIKSRTSIIKTASFIDTESCQNDTNDEYPNKDSKTALVLECDLKSDTQDSVHTPILVTSPNKNNPTIVDDEVLSEKTNNTSETTKYGSSKVVEEMKQLLDECLNFVDTPKLISINVTEDTNLTNSDLENITSIESETYETGSSLCRTYDARSLASLTQSFTDFSSKSQPLVSKNSEPFTNESWCNVSTPSRCSEVPSEKKDNISVTQKPKAGLAFSSFSVNTKPSPLAQQPDYVNLVDSETGSCAQMSRRATSEELLVSGRSSESFVSCAMDEDAAIPSWLYNVSQQASVSFSSSRQAALPEAVPDLEYDVNGNELTVHGAGAGDGCGIHSDPSQDSSGQGTSFSSSTSSAAHSEAIVVDPASYLAGYEPGERPNSSVAPLPEVSSDNLDVAAAENQNRPLSRLRSPRNTHRVSLPASDADISSLDTDLASD